MLLVLRIREEAPRAFVSWASEDLRGVAFLDDLAVKEEGDTVGHLAREVRG